MDNVLRSLAKKAQLLRELRAGHLTGLVHIQSLKRGIDALL